MVKMKLFASVLFLPPLLSAAILPDDIGAFHRAASVPLALADQPVWSEYGLQASESARYENGARHFTASAWQLQDTTGALAAFEWQRPGEAAASPAAPQAAETRTSLLLRQGNYLLRFDGYKPSREELEAVAAALKNVDATSLPVLSGYLPAANLVPNSERYVTGPAGLAKFDPAIPPSVAAFHLGSEAQIGVFHSPKGNLTLAIFNFPTAQMAIQKLPDFEGLDGAVAKRSGPMIAVVLSPADPDFAEGLLAQVRYQASVTRDEYVPTRRDNIGVLIINIFIFIGILAAFSIVSGLFVGAVRTWLRRGPKGEEPEPMITLHLSR
jgi:hypothetical protein